MLVSKYEFNVKSREDFYLYPEKYRVKPFLMETCITQVIKVLAPIKLIQEKG